MKAVKRFFGNLAILSLVFGCAAGLFNGCGPSRENLSIRPVDGDEIQLDSAMIAYESGDFQKAAERFQSLWNTAVDPAVKKTALHGLACARLVLAEKPEEFNVARELWRRWRYTPGPDRGENDVSMYGPVMEKWFATENFGRFRVGNEEESTVPPLFCPEIFFPVESGYAEAFAEAAAQNAELRERLEKREDEVRILRRQTNKMEKALKALKEQIAAIEEIHLEINEKKKGIQNP